MLKLFGLSTGHDDLLMSLHFIVRVGRSWCTGCRRTDPKIIAVVDVSVCRCQCRISPTRRWHECRGPVPCTSKSRLSGLIRCFQPSYHKKDQWPDATNENSSKYLDSLCRLVLYVWVCRDEISFQSRKVSSTFLQALTLFGLFAHVHAVLQETVLPFVLMSVEF